MKESKSNIETKWLNKHGEIGATSKKFKAFCERQKNSVYDTDVVCVDCGWRPIDKYSLEWEVHAFLTGHTVRRTATKHIKFLNNKSQEQKES